MTGKAKIDFSILGRYHATPSKSYEPLAYTMFKKGEEDQFTEYKCLKFVHIFVNAALSPFCGAKRGKGQNIWVGTTRRKWLPAHTKVCSKGEKILERTVKN